MSDTQSTNPVPQFSTAEYSGAPASDACKVCKAPITGTYYRANGSMVCGSCADRLQRELPQDNHAAFVRALLFGLVGFAIGMALYSGFVIATGISIGYLALAVGWIVGKAMSLGSKGIGGRRYQVVAVLLTYAAVSIGYVPVMIYYVRKENAQQEQVQQQRQQVASDLKPAADGSSPQPSSTQNAQQEPEERPSLMRTLGYLALWGLASPFLRLASTPTAFIGLIILFVGMQFAWKMTAGHPKIAVDGPYQVGVAT